MPTRKRTPLALLALALMVLSAPTALADDGKAFMEVTAGDLTDFEVWEDSHVSTAGDVYYNRVDGLLLYVGAQYYSDTQLHPRLKAMWGWPSARSGSYYQLEFEQPVHSHDSFSFGFEYYDKSAWSLEDEETISDFGNNMHAFWGRIDNRDYFRRDGVTVFAQHRLTPEIRLRAEYRSDRLSSLSEQQSVWSVFGREDDWSENPPLGMGVLAGADTLVGSKRMSSYVWTAEYDSREDDPTTGWWARAISEYGGKSAGGDYKFTKHIFQTEKSFSMTSTQSIVLSGIWGVADGTDFPSHKLFHLGGRGNLRGYEYKEFTGKDVLFGRAEYKVQMTEPLQTIFFLEAGEVSYGSTAPDSDDSDGNKDDAGMGVLVEAPWAGWLRLDFARALEEEAEIQWYLTLLLTEE